MSPETKYALTIASGVALLSLAIFYTTSAASHPSIVTYKGVEITTHEVTLEGVAMWASDFSWNGTTVSIYGKTSNDALADAQRTITAYKGA